MMSFKILFLIIIVLFMFKNSVFCYKEWVQRNARYLPFPMGLGNKLQIIAGFGIPVELERDSVTFGLIVKTNYALPTNASQFTNPEEAFADFSKKKLRSSLYEALIGAFDRMAFGGRGCLLRVICESAYAPISHNGVLGQILHVILMPSTTQDLDVHQDYYEAERLGRGFDEHHQCAQTFANCTTSLLDVISRLESLPLDQLLTHFNWL